MDTRRLHLLGPGRRLRHRRSTRRRTATSSRRPAARTSPSRIGANCYAELVRNLGEAYQDATATMRDMLQPGASSSRTASSTRRTTLKFEAKHLVFLGRSAGRVPLRGARTGGSSRSARSADFYLNAQFPDGHVDFREYRTQITVEGTKVGNALRQETDTISRLVYGFATAYLLTGEDSYLEARREGHRVPARAPAVHRPQGGHRLLVPRGRRRRAATSARSSRSEFGDDYDAIPAYEQIYALAGPTQTYRITGDPAILRDIEMTLQPVRQYFQRPGEGRLLLAHRPGHASTREPSRWASNRAQARTGTRSATTRRPT